MTDREALERLHRKRQTHFRTEAAMAAAFQAAKQIARDDGPDVSNPLSVLRSILWDLIDGAYGEGYSSGEDQPTTNRGAE